MRKPLILTAVLSMLVAFCGPAGFPASALANAAGRNSGSVRACFLGNSHVGALRQALRRGHFTDPNMEIVFWGFPGKSYKELKFEHGKFTHPDRERALRQTKGRYESIARTDCEVLVFVGPGFRPGLLMARLKAGGDLSFAAIESHLQRMVAETSELQLMTAAARGYQGKVYFVPWPLVSELSGRRRNLHIGKNEFAQFNRIAAKVFSEVGVTYIAQPEETIRDNKWTRSEYSRDGNFVHMNAQYGEVILRAIRERVRTSR